MNLVYCLTNWLFFDIPLLYFYINLSINNFLSFFGRYVSSLKYFFIMLLCKYFWINFLWSFWDFWNFPRPCRASDFNTNQISSCLWCFLYRSFWNIFKCICNNFFGMINKFLAVFTTQVFTYILINILSKRQKSIEFYKYLIFFR